MPPIFNNVADVISFMAVFLGGIALSDALLHVMLGQMVICSY
jgi:hypothetical protein